MAKRLAALPEVSAVGVIYMPGYDIARRLSSSASTSSLSWRDHPRSGYLFEECSTVVQYATSALYSLEKIKNVNMTFTGIFHDWGTVAGILWANRVLKEEEAFTLSPSSNTSARRPDRLILFDVGAGLSSDTRIMRSRKSLGKIIPALTRMIHQTICTVLYWFYFVTQFALQRWVSCYIASGVGGFLNLILELTTRSPLRNVDHPYGITDLRVREWNIGCIGFMSYPYWNTLTNTFPKQHFHLPSDLTKTPLLLMTGEDKNAIFHDEDAADFLRSYIPPLRKRARGDSNWISLPNAGHWLFLQQPKVCFDAVVDFMLPLRITVLHSNSVYVESYYTKQEEGSSNDQP